MADPLSTTASLIAVWQVVGGIIVSCYSYQQCSKNALKDASSILLETQTLRNVIERLLAQVREDESSGGTLLTSLTNMIGGDGCVFKSCQRDLTSLEKRLQSPVKHWKRLGKRLIWPLQEGEIVKQVQNIHRMRSVIESGLAVDTAASIREIQKNTRELKQRVLAFQDGHNMTGVERLHVMLEWLSAFNPSAYHNMVRKNRTGGTGTWLLQGEELKRWRDSTDMTVLWMHGIPGCGKSVLTSSVIDHITESNTAQDHASAMAYYYFQFGDQNVSCVHAMLRSLVYQLSRWKGSPPAALEACASRHFSSARKCVMSSKVYADGVSEPTTDDLTSVLRGILEELDQVYLVIDGLDECVDQDDLLHLVGDMLEWNFGNVHVFVAGRYQHELCTILATRKSLIIEIDSQVVDGDIQLFIQQQLASHPKLRRWPAQLQAEIHDSLNKGSQGMFRWVSCQVEVIAKCMTPKHLARALESLPKSLSASYTSIIAQIDEFHWEYATKILLWLAISSRPLLVEEAADGLAIDFEADDGPVYDPDLRLHDVWDVMNMCATLVTPCKILMRHDGALSEFTELRLAHHTVKDYLLSDFFRTQFAQPVAFNKISQVHDFVAKTSIAYLLSLVEPLIPAQLHERPLSRYAAQFWLSHYTEAESNQVLRGLAMQLLKSHEPYKNWCRLYDPTRPWREPNLARDVFLDPLYYLSSSGVEPLVSQLLQAGSDPATQGEVHASCLQAAAYNGHSLVVEVLLQAGANPNDGGGLCACPLRAAVVSGHNEIVKMLLEHGADPEDDRAGHMFSEGGILLEACRQNNSFAVKLLINAGASPDHHLEKGSFPTALEVATARGFQECMRLLLPKTSRSIALRALWQACRTHGTPEILEIFQEKLPDAVLYHAHALGLQELAGKRLEYDATRIEVNKGDHDRLCGIQDYSPAGVLYRACDHGDFGLVQKLIQEGVDVNVDDEFFGPGLAVAAYRGHLDVVKFLIHSGAVLTNCNGMYGGPAQAAVLGNRHEVLELVVSAGADINMPVGTVNRTNYSGTDYNLQHKPLLGSPLQAATFMASHTAVEWLLEHGANVNYGGGHGGRCFECGPPLVIASSQGNVHLVDRLLEAGADVNQRTGKHYGFRGQVTTPLEVACEKGHIAVVERLIRAGAAIELEDDPDRGSPGLAWAVATDSLAIVTLLLENGANPNSLGTEYRENVTVLAQACMRGNAGVVSALIEAGADVHRTSRFAGYDEPPFHTAASRCNVDVIRVLLKHGANVNDQTSEGFTALHKAARGGCAGCVQVLLEEGRADYSRRLINGSQPIHYAAQWNNSDCMKVLVEAGADINSRNKSGKTPLHWATEHHGVASVQWLLNNGADPRLAEYETNLTPHDYAVLGLEQAEYWDKDEAAKILGLLSKDGWFRRPSRILQSLVTSYKATRLGRKQAHHDETPPDDFYTMSCDNHSFLN